MKSVFKILVRLACASLLIASASAAAQGQTGARVQVTNLDRLAPKASESVEVNIDETLLKLGGQFLSAKDPEEAKVKELVEGIKGIYVKSYEFEREGEYATADVESIRTQLKAPGWAKIIDVRSKKEGDVEVYLFTSAGKVGGLTLLGTEPKRLTVINIVGPVDLDKLSRLEGKFGIPELELEREGGKPGKN